jgi:hypothetical protein
VITCLYHHQQQQQQEQQQQQQQGLVDVKIRSVPL